MGILSTAYKGAKGAVKVAKRADKAGDVAELAETISDSYTLAGTINNAGDQEWYETAVDVVELTPVVGDCITAAKIGWEVGTGTYDVVPDVLNAGASTQNAVLEAVGSDERVIEDQYRKTRVINDILNLNFTPETQNVDTGLRSRDNFSTIIMRDENGSSIPAFQAYIDKNRENGLSVNTWIENERDPNHGSAMHPYSTPFSAAIGLQKYELAAYMLKNDQTYINTKNSNCGDKTPFMILLNKPASPKRDALIDMMLNDKRLMVLDAQGKDVVDNNGFNIAMHAADNASYETMHRIIEEKGGNANHINNAGENIIHRAVNSPNSAEKISYLIKKGVDPNKLTNEGDSALSYALGAALNNPPQERQSDYDQTVKILLDHADEKVIDTIQKNPTSSQNMDKWLEEHPEVREEIKKNPNHPFHKHLKDDAPANLDTQVETNTPTPTPLQENQFNQSKETPKTEGVSTPTAEPRPQAPQPPQDLTPTAEPKPQPSQPVQAPEPKPQPAQDPTPTAESRPQAPQAPQAPTPMAEPRPQAPQPAQAPQPPQAPTPMAKPKPQPSQPPRAPAKPEGQTPPSSPHTDSIQPKPHAPRKFRHYTPEAIKHAQNRLSQFKNKNISGVTLTDKKLENAKKNIENTLIAQGYPPHIARQNADVILYKLVQANKLYHPNEKVNNSDKTVSETFGGDHRVMLQELTKDPKEFTSDQLKTHGPVLAKIEETISMKGHGLKNVKLKNQSHKSSYDATQKTGFDEKTEEPDKSPSDLRRTLGGNAQTHKDNPSTNQRGEDMSM